MTSPSDGGYNTLDGGALDTDGVERLALFPTIFWRFRLGDEELLSDLAQRVVNERETSAGRTVSNEGGWQSEPWESNAPIVGALHRVLLSAARVAFDDLGLTTDLPLIARTWANSNKAGDSNRAHSHGSAVLAAVLYVQTGETPGQLSLLDPRLAAFTGPTPAEATEINRREFRFSPSAGDLVLFPGWVLHRVNPGTPGTGARISIAANIAARPETSP